MELNYKLKTGLQTLNCSALAFSALAAPPITTKKLSQQTISQILAGTRELTADEGKEFLEVVNVMQHIQDTIVPSVPINWSDVLGVKDVLIQTFEQRKNELDPIHRRLWFVRLSLHNFFKGLRSDGSVTETINYHLEGAAFTNYELAAEVVRKLHNRDVPARVEQLTAERRQSTVSTSLEELGF